MALELPLLAPPLPDLRRLPRWLKREVPKGNVNHFTSSLLEELKTNEQKLDAPNERGEDR